MAHRGLGIRDFGRAPQKRRHYIGESNSQKASGSRCSLQGLFSGAV